MRADHLIDHLAELASQRNQDLLDGCFLDLFQDLLSPASVAIFRPEGDDRAPYWGSHRRTPDTLTGPLGPQVPFVPQAPLDSLPLHLEAWNTGVMRQQLGSPALTLVPMGCKNQTHCLVEILGARPLGPEEERVVRGVQRYYQHLRTLMDDNERDSLTRLLNRKSFDETFVRMAMQLDAVTPPDDPGRGGRRRPVERNGSRCWLAVVDVDHFKRVNDQHGHLIGDEVLILVAQLMRKSFRSADCLYRFGGEEFVVLLRHPRNAAAVKAFERLRTAISRFDFPQAGKLTVSIGFTEVRPSDTPSTAFERADQAVYHAKSHGRNRTVAHEVLIRRGELEAKPAATAVEYF